jgi:predicted lipoprotein with Yx(FWY)xxD motif
VVVAAAGCGGVSAAAKSRPTTKLELAGSRYGKILVDGKGRTLYLFTREKTRKPRCFGSCAAAWPPLLVHGRPGAGDGLRPGLLGTTHRRDGHRQLTYRGHPLYRYAGDRRPGQIRCQAVFEYGGGWFVVSPQGTAIR